MLTKSNSRNFFSESIINNLEKLLIKITDKNYRFQWDFSLQILSHYLCILNQILSYNFCVISQRAFLCHSICCVLMYMHILIIFMNFESAPFLCLLFKFRPAIYSKSVNFILSFESFIANETFVWLFNTR